MRSCLLRWVVRVCWGLAGEGSRGAAREGGQAAAEGGAAPGGGQGDVRVGVLWVVWRRGPKMLKELMGQVTGAGFGRKRAGSRWQVARCPMINSLPAFSLPRQGKRAEVPAYKKGRRPRDDARAGPKHAAPQDQGRGPSEAAGGADEDEAGEGREAGEEKGAEGAWREAPAAPPVVLDDVKLVAFRWGSARV